jgi:hypothetical protein
MKPATFVFDHTHNDRIYRCFIYWYSDHSKYVVSVTGYIRRVDDNNIEFRERCVSHVYLLYERHTHQLINTDHKLPNEVIKLLESKIAYHQKDTYKNGYHKHITGRGCQVYVEQRPISGLYPWQPVEGRMAYLYD